ncbi:MAG TPA: DoxX family protein [Patescibacteria group bacterium]|nr:DoxX family protein [Patescibacteria group bacterium]
MIADLGRYASLGFWVMQAVVGIIFIYHSGFKIKHPSQIASAYGAPAFVGLAHGLVELVGGALLVVNFYAQPVAFIFGLIMLGAIYMKMFKWNVGFFAHDKTGWEFDLILLACCVAIVTRV